ncbi:dihydrolipoamide acetyltransferase family protein [Nocardia jinanensis]|uniref:Dihydrolipoamide acetyltransferase component of pyruvate dehydrogenase complex n=1 Tax=Nocardia jinanensis TaxID=382504 RepID=A0A917VYC2_9NOCA|nr:dihydrolipoamide acetyltransferase family protein [Nocardia jinanensis]GGL36024.1 dihydrolipoamide acetyltransferase component of pyruvate dehydrogenase complex [Nocardia jinanensis]
MDEDARADEGRAADTGEILEFRLPDLGEGLTDAEFQNWSVAVGDEVALNQTIAEVETAKAVVALPSPFAGTVVELLAEPGETIEVGAPLLRIRTTATESGSGRRPSVLVGYGPSEERVSRRRRGGQRPEDAAAPPAQPSAGNGVPYESGVIGGASNSSAHQPVEQAPERAGDTARAAAAESQRVAATPGARKLARELGIDLWFVAGSGPDGAVTVADVRGAVPVSEPDIRDSSPGDTVATEPVPGSAREERTPIAGIRKRTADAMVASARTIPQADTSITVDVTASLELLEHLRATKAFEGITPTPLALVAKSVLAAVAEFPVVNTFWDEANAEIVTRHYVNLGIAVATGRGLLVPNIKDAQTLSLRELCREINWLAQTARDGRSGLADLRGGTFTISNVGIFGVESGTPLVNPGEAAILCLGAVVRRPWVFRDELAIRSVATLTLSFDHRMIDGEAAARFLAAVAGLLEDPLTLLARI